jgi:hypothetical protein
MGLHSYHRIRVTMTLHCLFFPWFSRAMSMFIGETPTQGEFLPCCVQPVALHLWVAAGGCTHSQIQTCSLAPIGRSRRLYSRVGILATTRSQSWSQRQCPQGLGLQEMLTSHTLLSQEIATSSGLQLSLLPSNLSSYGWTARSHSGKSSSEWPCIKHGHPSKY